MADGTVDIWGGGGAPKIDFSGWSYKKLTPREDKERGWGKDKTQVIAKWNEYMKDVIEFKIDPDTGTVPAMELMFYHE